MKYIFMSFLLFTVLSCSNESEGDECSKYIIRVSTNPDNARVGISYEEKGKYFHYKIQGFFEKEIYNCPRDSRWLSVIESSKSVVKNPYIKVDLYKGKKLIKSVDGNYVVDISLSTRKED